MKPTLSCIYSILLLTSIVSSALLFIIVASEGTKGAKDTYGSRNKGSSGASANITISDSGGENDHDSHVTFPSRIGAQKETQRNIDDVENIVRETADAVSHPSPTTNGEKTAKELPELELFGDVLSQQPNLSQGIPEADQAVVLTLVDTAAAELQSLTEPRISLDKLGNKSVVSNLSLALSNSARVSEPTELSSPSELLTSTNLKADNSLETSQNLTTDREEQPVEHEDKLTDQQTVSDENDTLEVVIVRADQSSGKGGEEEVIVSAEELRGTEDRIENTSELPENEARVRLTGGSAEDASVMLDVLVTATGTDPHEDIPSFSEWAQKRLEEAEKKKTHPNASSQNPGGPGGRGIGSTKVRSKNYASPDCGAKIVAVNPEAGSASSVLSSSRDEYMLNTCTSRVWFVVELCEAIQAEKIELANFELFSSSPRDFSVFVGDRFPTRDWSVVGQFAAKDERDIQSFALHPRLFGKFIKVELHSHYGSEHFCPVSLFRAYGTSEFEVLETENQIQESLGAEDDDTEEEEEMLDIDTGDPPRNLFGSARDAVLSIVKKAAEVLVKSGNTVNNNTQIRASIEDTILQNSLIAACMTPRYTVLCYNCTETMFAKVFQLVSCNDQYLDLLLHINFVNKTLHQSDICPLHGIRIKEVKDSDDLTSTKNEPAARFVTSLFPPQYPVALCNVLAARESRVIVNTSYYVTGNNSEGAAALEDALIVPPQGMLPSCESSSSSVSPQSSFCVSDTSSPACKTAATFEQQGPGIEFSTPVPNDVAPSTENLGSLIRPTKTITKDDGLKKEPASSPLLEPSQKAVEESVIFEPPMTASIVSNHQATTADKISEDPGIQGTAFATAPHITAATSVTETNTESSDISGDTESGEAILSETETETEAERDHEMKISPQDQLSLDTLLSDLKDLDADSVALQNNPAAPSATLSQPIPTPQQKESVFLRLSNRIKTLERNMSLSGQYLEELSKRYKKQVEEMQRTLERAIAAMSEESRRAEERETKKQGEITELKEQVSTLTRSLNTLLSDRDSWRSKFSMIGQHVVLICVEIVIVLMVLSYCRRNGDLDEDVETSTESQVRRRKSVGGTNECVTTKKMKKRRPSEIASHVSGTYHELMIEDSAVSNEVRRKEKRRKRKRDSISKGSVVTVSNFSMIKPIRRENLNTIPGGTNLPSRRASSSDATKLPGKENFETADVQQRPDSAPETCLGWFSEQTQPEKTSGSLVSRCTVSVTSTETSRSPQRVHDPHNHGIEDIIESRSRFEIMKRKSNSQKDPEQKILLPGKPEGILKNRRIPAPAFMKTALESRSKRLSNKKNLLMEPTSQLKSDNWEWYSKNSGSRSSQEGRESSILSATVHDGDEAMNGFSANNGKYEDSDELGSICRTPSSGSIKEKKTYGIKKMVKKLF